MGKAKVAKATKLPSSKATAGGEVVGGKFHIDCELRQPLGYTTFCPVDGSSLDGAMLDAVKFLRLRSGDRVTVTVTVPPRE